MFFCRLFTPQTVGQKHLSAKSQGTFSSKANAGAKDQVALLVPEGRSAVVDDLMGFLHEGLDWAQLQQQQSYQVDGCKNAANQLKLAVGHPIIYQPLIFSESRWCRISN